MICWYCYWGWPEQVFAIYKKGFDVVGESGMDFGPAHIVWADENFDAESIRWCIDNAEWHRGDLADEDLAVVVEGLHELLALPENILCCVPSDYDGYNPQAYPPPDDLRMVKRR